MTDHDCDAGSEVSFGWLTQSAVDPVVVSLDDLRLSTARLELVVYIQARELE